MIGGPSRPPRGQSVHRQLVTRVVVVYAAVMAVFAAQLVLRQRAFLREKAQSWTLFQGTLLAASALPGVMSNDVAGLQEILETLRGDQQVVYAMVLDPRGYILAHTDRRKNGLFLQDARSIEFLRSQPIARVLPTSDGSVECAAPVMLAERHFGWLRVKRDLSDDTAHLRSLTYWGAAFTILAIAIGAAVTTALAGAILRPLKLLLRGTERISQNRLDEPIPITTQNEVGVVTKAFNDAMAQLARQTAERTQAEEQLRAQTAHILEEAVMLAPAAEEILSAATRFAASAADAAVAVRETAVSIEEIRQTSHLASVQAGEVLQDAKSAAAISHRGKEAAEGAGEGMQRIRDQMAGIAAIMQELSRQTQVIGEIIASVDAIAATSSLLAVNAAIEARKAGEQGRGFSVVAQEVKHLATQSKQATARVRAILNDIQKAAAAAVLATQQGLSAVNRGAAQSNEAGGSIITLAESISKAALSAAQIAASSREQLTGIEQVAEAMHSVKTASAQNVEGATSLEKAARKLSAMGQRLSGLVKTSSAKQ